MGKEKHDKLDRLQLFFPLQSSCFVIDLDGRDKEIGAEHADPDPRETHIGVAGEVAPGVEVEQGGRVVDRRLDGAHEQGRAHGEDHQPDYR